LRLIKESFHATLKEVENINQTSTYSLQPSSFQKDDKLNDYDNSDKNVNSKHQSLESSLQNTSDQSVCIIDDITENYELNKTDHCHINKTFNPVIKNEECISINEEDDDDCRIISDSENIQDEGKGFANKIKNVHLNDKLNRPDENGQVLVNMNHPSEDSDIFLMPFLSKNVKPHQIGAIRFIYDK
jgi:RAD54-like protein 2